MFGSHERLIISKYVQIYKKKKKQSYGLMNINTGAKLFTIELLKVALGHYSSEIYFNRLTILLKQFAANTFPVINV